MEYYHNFIEAVQENTILTKTDIDGTITYVNDEFCKISGFKREELLGKNHNIIRHPDIPDCEFGRLWSTIKNKKTYKGTLKILSKDRKKTYYLNTTIFPILDKNNSIQEYIAIRYDVTYQQELELTLRKKEKELEAFNKNLEKLIEQKTHELKRLNENLQNEVEKEIKKSEEDRKVLVWQSRMASIGQMLANIAHQWRQPLTELNLGLFNLKKAAIENSREKIDNYYTETRNTLTSLSQTIDDFSNFFNSKKSSEYFYMDDSVNNALNILEQVLQKDNVKVKFYLKKLKIYGIENELTQVIINLLQNAKEAYYESKTKNKIITIKTEIVYKNRCSYASLKIKDNAKGIPDEIFDKIYEPYFTTKHESQGTGLGLFMSKMIVEQSLNGSIEAKNLSNGVTFTINIPLEK